MANNKSAQKRILVNKRNRSKNRYYLSSVRSMTKKFLNSLDNKSQARKLLDEIYSLIDKGTKKVIVKFAWTDSKHRRVRSKAKVKTTLF